MSFIDTDHLIAAEQAHSQAITVLSIFERIEPDDRRQPPLQRLSQSLKL